MWKHFFLPHPETHKKAHLISWQALVIYILLFILLQVSFVLINQVKPGVLGTSSNISQHTLIDLTNKERAERNLNSLHENENLDKAAEAKAQNMFNEDYWAHFAPSGKDPWGFILSAGYKFSYAGENLARNFYNSTDVVSAWMASPTHKDNILNPKYRDIGIAVVDGILKGQKTTLVVQMFGTPIQAFAINPSDLVAPQKNNEASLPIVDIAGKKISLNNEELKAQIPIDLTDQMTKSLPSFSVDPYFITKTVATLMLMGITLLLLIDFYVIRKRGVIKIASRHLPHLAMLSLGASALLLMKNGSIL